MKTRAELNLNGLATDFSFLSLILILILILILQTNKVQNIVHRITIRVSLVVYMYFEKNLAN